MFSIRVRWLLALLLASAVLVAACGSDDSSDADDATGSEQVDDSSAESTVPADASAEVLRIMVSNDDGVTAPGLDALVNALIELPDTEVEVVAPLENQSGTGSNTSRTTLEALDAETASGVPALAVPGFPADTVVWAIDDEGLDELPHVVIVGINKGQNIGEFSTISGTVGAAKAAAQRGVPALAASQGGLIEDGDYPSGVSYVLGWLGEQRADLLDGSAAVEVTSLNIPTCTTGEIRGLLVLPTAESNADREVLESNCESTLENPVDDVEGFVNGFVTQSVIPHN